MRVFFWIPWHLKSDPAVSRILKTYQFVIMVSAVRLSLYRLWWYHLFQVDRTILIKT